MEWFPSDLLDPVLLRPALDGVEYVVHIAGVTKAKNRSEYYRNNVQTTQTLLQLAAQIPTLKKFCLLSSLAVVGPSADGIPLDESAPHKPITTYGQSKLEAELLARDFSGKIPIVILRPAAVYGPRDPAVLEMFQWIARGIIPLIGKEEKTLSFIHAADLARGIAEATFSDRTTGNTYHISEERIHTYTELVEFIGTIMDKKAIRVRLPSFVIKAIAAATELMFLSSSKTPVLNLEKVTDLLQPHWVCSPAKIKQDIGFETHIPTFDGLLLTYNWYRQMKWI